MTNNILLQYLRKSELANDYMAGYLNFILRSLQRNDKCEYDVFIRGACWTKKFNTAESLVDKVLEHVDKDTFNFILINSYKDNCYCYVDDEMNKRGYTTNHTCLKNEMKVLNKSYYVVLLTKLHNMYIRGKLTCNEFCENLFILRKHFFSQSKPFIPFHFHVYDIKDLTNKKANANQKEWLKGFYSKGQNDHSKEILITCSGEIVFYMVGSSNFSNVTYATKDRGINQSEIAFIFDTKYTKNIIGELASISGNEIAKYFTREYIGRDEETNEIINDEEVEAHKSYLNFLENRSIVTTPYVGDTSFFDNILDSMINDLSDDIKKNREDVGLND